MSSAAVSALKRAFDRPPAGYRPGALLRRGLAELEGRLPFTMAGPGCALLGAPQGLCCEVRERVEHHFLMHIVALEFRMQLPSLARMGARMEIRHTGLWSRSGIECLAPRRLRGELAPVMEALAADAALNAALLALDFRSCHITGSQRGWTVSLEPYRASEVVSRMPSFRRYLPLGKEHAEALILALLCFRRLLGPP